MLPGVHRTIENKPKKTHALIGLVPFYKTEQKTRDDVTQRKKIFSERLTTGYFLRNRIASLVFLDNNR